MLSVGLLRYHVQILCSLLLGDCRATLCLGMQTWGDEELGFQPDLPPTHSAKTKNACCNEHDVIVLDWSENSPDRE